MVTRIAVVGNCQAAPIGTILGALSDQVEITGVTTVHDLNDSAASRFAPIFETADIIISQQIADSYPIRFVRTRLLQEQYASKVITMPNIFWRGYGAELITIKDSHGKNVQGILGDYHNDIVLRAFQANHSIDETLARFSDLDHYREHYREVGADSLRALKNRERELDLRISDALEQGMSETRLFHTFNHPSSRLLLVLARRILDRLAIPVTTPIDASYIPDFLATFIPALMPATVHHLGLTFEAPDAFRGFDVDPEGPGTLSRKWTYMNTRGYIERSFRLYAAERDIYLQARLNPAQFSAQLPAMDPS